MKLRDIERGNTFEYRGNKWIVLEHDSTGHTLVLSEDIIAQKPFNLAGRSNWATSSLREDLRENFQRSLCGGTDPNKYNFIPIQLN